MSHFPKELGRTCDDAHTVLIDPEFDMEKWKENRWNNQNNVRQPVQQALPVQTKPAEPVLDDDFNDVAPQQLKPLRFTRTVEGSVSSEQKRATSHFDTSLPYQPKQPTMENPFQPQAPQQKIHLSANTTNAMLAQNGAGDIQFLEDNVQSNNSISDIDPDDYEPSKDQPKVCKYLKK